MSLSPQRVATDYRVAMEPDYHYSGDTLRGVGWIRRGVWLATTDPRSLVKLSHQVVKVLVRILYAYYLALSRSF